MVAALPVIVGFQLWLAAIMYDVMKTPRTPIHPLLLRPRKHRVAPDLALYPEPSPSLVPDGADDGLLAPAATASDPRKVSFGFD